jgi:hypothetical protein
MTVGQRSAPLPGDPEATKVAAAAGVQAPSSPRSPLPESRVCRGSRFWALAGESSEEEEEEDSQVSGAQGEAPPQIWAVAGHVRRLPVSIVDSGGCSCFCDAKEGAGR